MQSTRKEAVPVAIKAMEKKRPPPRTLWPAVSGRQQCRTEAELETPNLGDAGGRARPTRLTSATIRRFGGGLKPLDLAPIRQEGTQGKTARCRRETAAYELSASGQGRRNWAGFCGVCQRRGGGTAKLPRDLPREPAGRLPFCNHAG